MKLVCAPMATLTHEPFRRCIEKFGGCDEYFTEMINASSLVNSGPFEKYYLLNNSAQEKIVWQLTGSNQESLSQAAHILCEKGGIGIDINMGCCAPQIYKTGAGIAWITKPLKETAKTISAVKHVLDAFEEKTKKHIRLSVKCRLGEENFTEKSLFTFSDMLIENGVELITLHPRTKKEKLKGLPRYEVAESLALHLKEKAKIYVNGCIKDVESANFALQKVPDTNGLMIARAAAVRPWIFAEIQKREEKIKIDRLQVALDFIEDISSFLPPEFFKTRMQRFFFYYCQQFKFAHYFQTNMLNSKTPEESKTKVEEYFSKQVDERFIEI